MATDDEVLKALMAVMPLYANYKPPQGRDAAAFKAAWHLQVGHLDAEVLALAVRDAAAKSEFFPTPKLVLECAVLLLTLPARSGAEAWGEVTRAAIRHGGHHPPGDTWDFDDPLITQAVRAVGWRNICESDEGALMWPFIRAYDALTGRAQAAARELPAVTEGRVRLQGMVTALAQQLAAPKEQAHGN